MTRRVVFAISIGSLATVIAAATALAQAPSTPPPPGPEHKRLGYFVGAWAAESDMKASPFGPAGKSTGTSTAEWGPGGFFVVLRGEAKTPTGTINDLGVLGYDTQAKMYTFNGFDSLGLVSTGKGTLQGQTWTFSTEDKMGGKIIKGRFTINEVSPTSYTFKYDMQTDSGGWTTVEEGKATKSK